MGRLNPLACDYVRRAARDSLDLPRTLGTCKRQGMCRLFTYIESAETRCKSDIGGREGLASGCTGMGCASAQTARFHCTCGVLLGSIEEGHCMSGLLNPKPSSVVQFFADEPCLNEGDASTGSSKIPKPLTRANPDSQLNSQAPSLVRA